MARNYYYVRLLNRTSLLHQSRRNRSLKKIFAKIETPTYYVQSPIYVDYGFNTYIGKNVLSNYNLIIQDEGEVHIGDNVMIASNVVITTDLHPLTSQERNVHWVPNRFPHNHKGDYVYLKPIVIEDNDWICANVTVLPVVTIGKSSVIGAGSVVTRDIPANVLTFGTPCKVIRPISEEDRLSFDNILGVN